MNLRKAARGADCVLRIPNICNWNPETTVLAHVGSGTAKRNDDAYAVFACSDCHDAIDRRTKVFLADDPDEQELLRRDRKWFIARALERMNQINDYGDEPRRGDRIG